MRPIPDTLRERFLSDLQTAANNADPRLSAIISRGAFPVTSGADIARALITEADGLTACSVAVRRPRAGHEPDRVYVAYIDENGAHVKFSALGVKMGAFVWQDGGFSEDASDVALAFDGTMPKAADGTAQFVTGERPWVFWIESGVLKGRILGLLGDVTLASANAGRVSAIRATWTQATSTDFGLVVFFTLNGALYYRQLIDNVWYDAVPVSFGPPSVTWTDVAAFRTWDYRVGVQLLGSDGKVYELFTQFQGIGKHGAEHVLLGDAAARCDVTSVYYKSPAPAAEHVELSEGAVTVPYRYAYRIGPVRFLGAENVNDGGDWGRRVACHFDKEIDPGSAALNIDQFELTDSTGVPFIPESVEMSADGRTLFLIFTSINNAVGSVTVSYSPGTVQTMAGALLGAFSETFTPSGLVPVAGLPVLTAIYNE